MEFDGRYELSCSPQYIWDTLLDPNYIIKLNPEISTLRLIGPDQYQVTTDIKVGLFRKRFEGLISIERVNEPDQFQIKIEQSSPIGQVDGLCEVCISEVGNSSEVNYTGVVKMDGLLKKIGMPLVEKMIHPIIHQFFEKFQSDLTSA